MTRKSTILMLITTMGIFIFYFILYKHKNKVLFSLLLKKDLFLLFVSAGTT